MASRRFNRAHANQHAAQTDHHAPCMGSRRRGVHSAPRLGRRGSQRSQVFTQNGAPSHQARSTGCAPEWIARRDRARGAPSDAGGLTVVWRRGDPDRLREDAASFTHPHRSCRPAELDDLRAARICDVADALDLNGKCPSCCVESALRTHGGAAWSCARCGQGGDAENLISWVEAGESSAPWSAIRTRCREVLAALRSGGDR